MKVARTDAAQRLFDYVVDYTGVELSTVKIFSKGKRVLPSQAIGSLDLSGRLMVMGVTAETRKEVAQARSDPSLRTMEAEDERERRRRRADRRIQHDAFKFCKFVVVERFTVSPYHYFDASRLLQRLAEDVSFLMKRYRWTVGALIEMDPTDDRLLKKKEAEGDGGCLLGYNENAGARIYIRLRSDNNGPFRDYDDLVQTLLHELCHNAVGPHNAAFFALYATLRKDYLDDKNRREKKDEKPARIATLSDEKKADSKTTIENELARESYNNAISPAERASAALVSAAVHEWTPEDLIEDSNVPADVVVADKSLALVAAEKRRVAAAIRSDDEVVPTVERAPTNRKDDESAVKAETKSKQSEPASDAPRHPAVPPTKTPVAAPLPSPPPPGPRPTERDARIIDAATRLKSLSMTEREEATGTLLTILENAGKPDDKFKRVRLGNKKFMRTAGKFAASLDLLDAVGFEKQSGPTPSESALVLTRDDPALRWLGQSALRDIVLASEEEDS